MVNDDNNLLEDLVYDGENGSEKLDLGEYFTERSINMLQHIPITKVGGQSEHRDDFVLVAFVNDADVYDSIDP